MTTIYLIRHAQADGNLYRRCQAWYDSLVTDMGYRQIDALKERFGETHFDAVYSSDLFRTMTTAKSIYLPHQLELQTDSRLREIRSGNWEDRTWGELYQTDRENLLAFWRCDPHWHTDGSETFQEAQQRFCTAVCDIASQHSNQTIAIFAHGCVIRTALAHWMGLPLEQIREIPHGDNTSVSKLEFDGEKIQICWYNDTTHLSPELARAPHPAAQTDEETASKIERTSLYFLPMDPNKEEQAYLNARENAWIASHGSILGYHGDAFLAHAKACYSQSHNSVLTAMLAGKPAGLLQMDFSAEAELGVGRIPFVYMEPSLRDHGLGVQLIGQAVSTYRLLGRQYLRLRCAPENEYAQQFYKKYGFYKIGEEPGGTGYLDTLEKYIGTESI